MLLIVALLALAAVIFFIFLVIKAQFAAKKDQDEVPLAVPDPALATNLREDGPSALRRDAFDPAATQFYHRPAPAAAAASVVKKDAGAPLAGALLMGLSGGQRGKSFALGEAGITVGRDPACDVVLADARVSGRHAWIVLVDGQAVLRDLNSTNGTFVNTSTQSLVGETSLANGDTIFFGGHRGDQFRFVAEPA